MTIDELIDAALALGYRRDDIVVREDAIGVELDIEARVTIDDPLPSPEEAVAWALRQGMPIFCTRFVKAPPRTVKAAVEREYQNDDGTTCRGRCIGRGWTVLYVDVGDGPARACSLHQVMSVVAMPISDLN